MSVDVLTGDDVARASIATDFSIYMYKSGKHPWWSVATALMPKLLYADVRMVQLFDERENWCDGHACMRKVIKTAAVTVLVPMPPL